MTKNEIINRIKRLDESELVALHNYYCEETSDYDNIVYRTEDFDELMSGRTATDIAQSIFFGDFNPNDNYFGFNGYGNLVSFGYATRLEDYICIDDIASDIWEDPTEYADYIDIYEE